MKSKVYIRDIVRLHDGRVFEISEIKDVPLASFWPLNKFLVRCYIGNSMIQDELQYDFEGNPMQDEFFGLDIRETIWYA